MPGYPSVCMEFGSHWTDLHKFWYFEYMSKICRESLGFKKIGHFIWRPMDICTISRSVLLRMTSVSDKSCRQNKNTHFMLKNFFFNSPLLGVNVEEYCKRWTGHNWQTRRLRIAWRVTKDTDTHSEYVIIIDLTLQ